MPKPFDSRAAFAWLLMAAGAAQAQEAWQACTLHNDPAQRLACFDRWAEGQRAAEAAAQAPAPAGAQAAQPSPPPPVASGEPPIVSAPGTRLGLRLTRREGCRDPRYSEMSRYWELEPGADCGDFGIRGYRPISIGAVGANTVNRQPTSDNPANNAQTPLDYRTSELRLQLSVRTKVAQGLFIDTPDQRDSLWFGYSQQSYWQLFTPALSRPFRSTDHEPEVVYIAPLQAALPGQWRLRYGGLAVTHQSNGQSLPLSRSWNRATLMAGAERGPWQLHARLWRRLPEDDETDDNPGITDFIGRTELRAEYHAGRGHLWALTARHSLKREARGSLRLEWFRSMSDNPTRPGGLQLHTQLFSGYGDSLLDYNRRRTMFSIGLSLVDW